MGKYDDLIQLAGSLPDDIRPEPEQSKQLPPTEDERLGIDTPLPSPRGILWDPKAREFRHAEGIGTGQPAGVIPERGLVHEDPAMDIALTTAGAGIGKAAGYGLKKLGAPIIAKIAEPAVASGASSYLGHGGGAPTMDDVKATGLGGVLGLLPAGVAAIKRAPEELAERLPTTITQGARTKAAKKVVLGGATDDVLDAHPELKKTIAGTTDPAKQLAATNSTLNKLRAPNDAAWDAIQQHKGGVPLQTVHDRLDALWEKARQESDTTTMDAVESYKKDLERLADQREGGPTLSAKQLRNVRNTLAAKIQRSPVGTPAFASEGAAVRRLHGAINEAAEDAAAGTPGVDVAAMKERNKQIAQLLDIQGALEERANNAQLGKFKSPVAKTIDAARHPAHAVAGLVDAADAKLNAKLAMNKTLQDFVNGVSPESVLNRGSKTPLGAVKGIPQRVANLAAPTGIAGIGSNALKPSPSMPESDRAYTAHVLQLMDAGNSMEDAVRMAGER
jgi:hypothetical protein